MAERKIRVRAVRREQIDVDKLVAGLLQLLREQADKDANGDVNAGPPEESAA